MDWKTDSDLNGLENEPYSSFHSNKSGKLFDRLELPIILVGAGLLALVILFVLFIPKKNEVTIDDYRHLVSRLDHLEDKIDMLSGKEIDLEAFDPAKNPVQYQQVINWIKSNAEVISETIKKVDEIEKTIKNKPAKKAVAAVSSSKEMKKLPEKKEAPVSMPETTFTPKASVKNVEKPKPAAEKKTIEKSNSVQVKPQKKIVPVVAEKPEKKKAVVAPAMPDIKVPPESIDEKPETVKFIFHRVEKGETLYRISRNYGISVEELQQLNDMKKNDLLIEIGQELIVKKVKQ